MGNPVRDEWGRCIPDTAEAIWSATLTAFDRAAEQACQLTDTEETP